MEIFGRLSIEKIIQELKQVATSIPRHIEGTGVITRPLSYFKKFWPIDNTVKKYGALCVPEKPTEEQWLEYVKFTTETQISIIKDIQTSEAVQWE